jgi:hypothetical protein
LQVANGTTRKMEEDMKKLDEQNKRIAEEKV